MKTQEGVLDGQWVVYGRLDPYHITERMEMAAANCTEGIEPGQEVPMECCTGSLAPATSMTAFYDTGDEKVNKYCRPVPDDDFGIGKHHIDESMRTVAYCKNELAHFGQGCTPDCDTETEGQCKAVYSFDLKDGPKCIRILDERDKEAEMEDKRQWFLYLRQCHCQEEIEEIQQAILLSLSFVSLLAMILMF